MNAMLLDPSAEASAKVAQGFTPAFALKLLAFARDTLSITDIVPPATWTRIQKQQGRLNKQHSEALYHALRTLARAEEVLGNDPEVKHAFLTHPNAALDGRIPQELLAESSVGAESVIRVLDSLSVGGPL